MFAETFITALLSVSLSLGFFWLLQDAITQGLDKILSVFGYTFAGRSGTVQAAAYILIILLAGIIIFFLLRAISGRKKLTKAVIIFSLAVILLLLADICFQQVIRRDDYWEIFDSQHYGFPRFLVHEFTVINGRYFNLLLKSMYAFFPPETYIHFALLIDLICLCAACIYLCHVLLSYCCAQHSFIRSAVGGAILMLAALFVSPKIWEVWFWAGGTFIYGVGITLAILILALFLDSARGKSHIILTLIAITCACGCSELITASVCSFSVGILLINWITGNGKRNKIQLLFVLWCFLCTAFVLKFSASAQYAGDLTSSNDPGTAGFFERFLIRLPEILRLTAETLWWFFYSRLEYVVYLAVLSFYFGLSVKRKKIRLLPFLSGVLMMLLTAAGSLTMNIFMDYTPGRVLTIPLIWIFLVIASCFFLLGSSLKIPDRSRESNMIPSVISLLLCILCCVFFKDNITLLRNINAGWHYRDEVIQEIADKSKPLTVCTIPVIGSTDRDLSEDPDFEMNLVTAVYYQAEKIIGGDPCPPFAGE